MMASIRYFIILIFTAETMSYEKEWNYEDQKSWSRISKLCAGKQQSPININIGKTYLNESLRIYYNYYDMFLDDIFVKNNGHTAMFKFDSKQLSNRPTITGSALNNQMYYFEQVHFHWGDDNDEGSEHTINGLHDSMEMHLVHWNSRYNDMDSASMNKDGLVVLAVLFKITRLENLHLNPIIESISNVEEFGEERPVGGTNAIKLDNLLPDDNIESFYQYKGSLTTPMCYETVTWIVYDEPKRIGIKQLEKFRKLQKNKDKDLLRQNIRQLQLLNERIIYASSRRTTRNSAVGIGIATGSMQMMTLFCYSFIIMPLITSLNY